MALKDGSLKRCDLSLLKTMGSIHAALNRVYKIDTVVSTSKQSMLTRASKEANLYLWMDYTALMLVADT